METLEMHANGLAMRPVHGTSADMEISGQDVICFAKDWSEHPTSNNHVMAELARKNTVLWLNSVSTRRPSLTSGRDIKKIFKKIGRFLQGAKNVQDNLWVYTPLVLPFPHSRVATALNRQILRMTIRMLRWKLGMKRFQLWSFLPNVADYVGTLGESFSVYYCTDEWSKFTYVNGKEIAAAENRLIRKVDAVFATAQSLVDNRIDANPNTFLARHGVDHELFAAALRESTPIPDDVQAIKGPRLGFYGTLQDWIDYDLIEFLAGRHPDWSLVLIGDALVDMTRLKKYPNVHLLGKRSHALLPNYCKSFSVGLIPYVLNERILHVNPIKLREYMSAGLPVVSAALPEVKMYGKYCVAAQTHEEFEAGIIEALKNDSPAARAQRSAAMIPESWTCKVAELVGHIDMVNARHASIVATGMKAAVE